MGQIMVTANIAAPVHKVREYYTSFQHIVHWNFASDNRQCPYAATNLTKRGTFSFRMEAKDGSIRFDFAGPYDIIHHLQSIACTLADTQKVVTLFHQPDAQHTFVTIAFHAETENPEALQQMSWQIILNHFKKYAESPMAA